MLLTPEQVTELTDRPQPKRQIEWLTRNGWTFQIGASGLPKVSRAEFDTRMGGKQQARRWEPDLSNI